MCPSFLVCQHDFSGVSRITMITILSATNTRGLGTLLIRKLAILFISIVIGCASSFSSANFYPTNSGACTSYDCDFYFYCPDGSYGAIAQGVHLAPEYGPGIYIGHTCSGPTTHLVGTANTGRNPDVSFVFYDVIVDNSSPLFSIDLPGDCSRTNDPPDGPKCKTEGSCCSGAPIWEVSQPYVNLWIHDEPLGYQPAKGPGISFKLSFKQRETDAGMDTNTFSVGKRWNFSWLSYVTKDANGTNVVLFPGGGQRPFNNDQDYVTDATITGNTTSGFTVSYPDGSKDVYGMIVTNSGGTFLKAFMTERWNAQSQKTTLYYSSYTNTNPVIRLQSVVDGDGRTNLISYNSTNPYSTNLISQVVDPFGRSASLTYDVNGRLTGITDAQGLSSSVAYGTSDTVASITTPYGTTSFSVNDPPSPDGRSVLVTQPDGGHQLYLYKENAAGVPWTYTTGVPGTLPFSNTLENTEMTLRNTFHWGPKQYTALSTTNIASFSANDFAKARLRHWLRADAHTVGQTLSMERDPSPDIAGAVEGQKVWFDYQGKMAPVFEGTQASPLFVARVLPDGTTNFTYTVRNSLGAITTNITTWSIGGTVLLRTNVSTYDANGIDLLTMTNALGVQVSSNSYNASHQVLTNYNALGEKTVYTYNGNQLVTSVTRPSGLITTNSYDTNNQLTNTYDYAIIGGTAVYYRTNSYTYANDLVFTHTDERGLITTNIYDNLQRLTNSSDARGALTYVYKNLDLAQVVDRMGFPTSYGYDSMRRKTAETNALGNYTLFNYCSCGSLDSVQDAAGNFTQFFYDNQARLTNTLYPDGFAVTSWFDLAGRITNSVDSAGTSSTNWFNNQGLIIAVSNAFGRVQATIFDALDRATNTIDANGVGVTNIYDDLNRPLARSYPDGGVEKFVYSYGVAQMTAYTNQISNPTLYGFDPLGRKTAETNANIEVTQFSYSPAGDLLTLTDGKNQSTTWIYDQFGRVTNKLDASSSLIFLYKYDFNNRLTNRWTPEKGGTTYGFDSVGNLTNVQYPASGTISLAYDVLNRLTNMVDSVGVTRYTYDAVGQLLSEDGPWNNDTVNYTYSNRLRSGMRITQPSASPWIQSYAWDGAKRLTNTASPAGSFGYTYDPVRHAQIQKLSLPNGVAITNSYDSVSRELNTVLINSAQAVLDSHQYGFNRASQRTQQVFTATNYVNYNYDPAGQLIAAQGFDPAAAATNRWHERLGYYYDAAGNLNRRTNNALIQTFGVNNLNELTTATRSGTMTVAGTTTSTATNVTVNTSNAFLYSDSTFAATNFSLANGSNTFTAIAKDAYGRSDTNVSIAYLPSTNSFVYDANGNLRTNGQQILDYDDENQLITNSVPGAWKSEFVYDGKMRRRIRREYIWQYGTWHRTSETRYVYDGNLVIQERDANNLPQISYTRGKDLSGSLQGAGGIGGLLARTDLRAMAVGSSAYYFADANGNITALINTNQQFVAKYVYDPFGNTMSASGPLCDANLYRFSSKEVQIQSGMYYYGYRFYDAGLERWINRDPVGERGRDGLNVYAFVRNNPADRLDANGKESWGPPFFPTVKPPAPPTAISCSGYGPLYPSSCTDCGKSRIDWYPGKARAVCESFAIKYTGTAMQTEAACVATCLIAAEAACQAASKKCDDRNCCRLAAHVKCYASCGFLPYKGLPPGAAGVGWNDLLPSVGKTCGQGWLDAAQGAYPLMGW
jgi:RHS repeat-associated protein